MADSFVSRFGCYTIIWDTTGRKRKRPKGPRSLDVPAPVNKSRITRCSKLLRAKPSYMGLGPLRHIEFDATYRGAIATGSIVALRRLAAFYVM